MHLLLKSNDLHHTGRRSDTNSPLSNREGVPSQAAGVSEGHLKTALSFKTVSQLSCVASSSSI